MLNRKEYTFEMGEKSVLLSCDRHLEKELKFFVRILEQEELEHRILQDGKTIQIGFFFYKIREEKQKEKRCYRVLACDIGANPFEQVTDDLSLFLSIFSKQNANIRAAGVQAFQTDFQQTMIVHKEAFKSKNVYLHHCEPVDEYDSGWYMGSLHAKASDQPDDYTKIYTFQLLSILPEALNIMMFPIGVMAIYEDGVLIEAVDENDRKLL